MSMSIKRRRSMRRSLLEHHPYCWFCGRFLTESRATIDHFVPRSKGGGNMPHNLRLACNTCNQAKADHPIDHLVCLLQRGVGIISLSQLEKVMTMARIEGFNYEALNAKQKRTARDAAKHIHSLLQRTGEAVVDIGRQLIVTKDALGTRSFRQWLDAEFQWGMPVAYSHMQAAREFGDLHCLGNFQPSALIVLARKNIPPAAVGKAIKRAKAGQLVTQKWSLELIAEHGVVPSRSDAGKPRSSGRDVREDALTAVQRSLDAFSSSIGEWAAKMTRDDRDALADRFLQLALELRQAGPAQPVRKTPRKRSTSTRRQKSAA